VCLRLPKALGHVSKTSAVSAVACHCELQSITGSHHWLTAPFPSALHSLRRQCSSGLQAIADVAAAIRAGFYTVGPPSRHSCHSHRVRHEP
jgi:acetyl-CoA acetyltransferase